MTTDEMIDAAVEGWVGARETLVAEAGVVPDDRFDHRLHPDARSTGEILAHVLATEAMFVEELTSAEGDLGRASLLELLEEYGARLPGRSSPAELRRRLETSMEETAGRLREARDLLAGSIRGFDGNPGPRIRWLHSAAGHESHHRGQITFLARSLGIVPAITRILEGDREREEEEPPRPRST